MTVQTDSNKVKIKLTDGEVNILNNFDSWKPTEGFPEGSGRSEKIWLISQDNKVGLFKFPKTEYTSEHISERLAYTLGKALEIECAEVEIGERDGRIGSISYLITDSKTESLKEGVQFIQAQSPYYREKDLYDPEEKVYYSVDHIFDSTAQQVEKEDWIEMLLFDFLIGNSDRHHNNWAIVSSKGRNRRSPLYDNGSSLCSYIMEDSLDKYFGKDLGPVTALTDTQSKSTVRIDKYNKKNPTHREVVEYLLAQYPRTTEPIAKRMLKLLTEGLFKELLGEFETDLISDKKKSLIEMFLNRKVDILKECLQERGDRYGN